MANKVDKKNQIVSEKNKENSKDPSRMEATQIHGVKLEGKVTHTDEVVVSPFIKLSKRMGSKLPSSG